MANPDMCIIYNPSAGRGRARRRLDGLRATLGSRVEFRASSAAGHAEQLAYEAAQSGFAVVGAAGGDGTVHEVANGLLSANRSDVHLAVYPIGSANDYAYALGLPGEWWKANGSHPNCRAVDVGVVRLDNGRVRHFVNGLGLGLQASVTIESSGVSLLQGVPLYTVAVLKALYRRYRFPRTEIRVDDTLLEGPMLGFSAAIGKREGNFLIAPDALVDDGLFDYLRVGRIGRLEFIRYIPGMITGNLPVGHPQLALGRCRSVRIRAREPLPIHLDGEVLARPEDGVHELEIDILPARLIVEGISSGKRS